MASNPQTVAFIVEQVAPKLPVAARKMFGEYGIFAGPKMVALVCDDQLFVKPTEPGRVLLGTPDLAPPYDGAKPYFLISGDRWDDADWLGELLVVTEAALPMPKSKPAKPKAPTS